MDINLYSFSDPLNLGIDFYTPDEFKVVQISISIDSSLTAKLLYAPGKIVSNLSIESNLVSSLTRIKLAESIIVIDGATLTLGTRIKLAFADLSGNVTVSVEAEEILFATATLSAESSVSVEAEEILLAQAAINSNSNVTVASIKLAKASVSITSTSALTAAAKRIQFISSALSSNVNLFVAGKITLATIRIAINNLGNVSARAIKFVAGNVISASDISDIRTVLLIDDKPITNHNRKLGVSVDPIFVENINWNNRKSRYYKSSARPARRTFNLSWSYVPNSHSHTVDGKRGRDYLKEIAGKPQHHVLKIVNMDENSNVPYTETSYNVLVKDYSETLIRRDLVDDIYFFDCSMSLEEV